MVVLQQVQRGLQLAEFTLTSRKVIRLPTSFSSNLDKRSFNDAST